MKKVIVLLCLVAQRIVVSGNPLAQLIPAFQTCPHSCNQNTYQNPNTYQNINNFQNENYQIPNNYQNPNNLNIPVILQQQTPTQIPVLHQNRVPQSNNNQVYPQQNMLQNPMAIPIPNNQLDPINKLSQMYMNKILSSPTIQTLLDQNSNLHVLTSQEYPHTNNVPYSPNTGSIPPPTPPTVVNNYFILPPELLSQDLEQVIHPKRSSESRRDRGEMRRKSHDDYEERRRPSHDGERSGAKRKHIDPDCPIHSKKVAQRRPKPIQDDVEYIHSSEEIDSNIKRKQSIISRAREREESIPQEQNENIPERYVQEIANRETPVQYEIPVQHEMLHQHEMPRQHEMPYHHDTPRHHNHPGYHEIPRRQNPGYQEMPRRYAHQGYHEMPQHHGMPRRNEMQRHYDMGRHHESPRHQENGHPEKRPNLIIKIKEAPKYSSSENTLDSSKRSNSTSPSNRRKQSRRARDDEIIQEFKEKFPAIPEEVVRKLLSYLRRQIRKQRLGDTKVYPEVNFPLRYDQIFPHDFVYEVKNNQKQFPNAKPKKKQQRNENTETSTTNSVTSLPTTTERAVMDKSKENIISSDIKSTTENNEIETTTTTVFPELGIEDTVEDVSNGIIDDYFPDFSQDKTYFDSREYNIRNLRDNRYHYTTDRNYESREKYKNFDAEIDAVLSKPFDSKIETSSAKYEVETEVKFQTPPSLESPDFRTKQIMRHKPYTNDKNVSYKSSTYSDAKNPRSDGKSHKDGNTGTSNWYNKKPRPDNIPMVYAHSNVAKYGKVSDEDEESATPVVTYYLPDNMQYEENGKTVIVAKRIPADHFW